MKEQRTPDEIIAEFNRPATISTYTTTYNRSMGSFMFKLVYHLGGLLVFIIVLSIAILILGAGIALWKYILT